MTFELSWYRPEKVICEAIIGKITIHESQKLVQTLEQYLEDSTASQVHIMIDLSQMADDTMTVHLLSTTITPLCIHRKVGWIVVFGQIESIPQLRSAITTQFFGMRYRAFETAEEALTFLRGKDPALETIETIAINEDAD